MNQYQKMEIEKLVWTSKQDLGCTDLVYHSIPTGDAIPIKQASRRLLVHYQPEVSKLLEKMQQQGIIKRSCSPWASPIVKKRHWDPARIWTWVFWMPVRCSYQLSHWSSGIGAEDGWYIHRHRSILRLDLISVGFALHGECWSNSPYSSTEELFAATPVNWVSVATVHVLSEPLQGLTGNISPGEKPYKVFCLPQKQTTNTDGRLLANTHVHHFFMAHLLALIWFHI